MVESIDRGIGLPPKTADYIVKKLDPAFLRSPKTPPSRNR